MIAARHKKLKEMLINEENEEIIKSKLIAYTSDQVNFFFLNIFIKCSIILL